MTKNTMDPGREPLPRYAMPDGSAPDYGAILERIQYHRSSMIGSSFFYIRARDTGDFCLCRIIPGGEKIFFHEIVDHDRYGISDDDLSDAEKYDNGAFCLPGHIHISPHIEKKLRALLETG